MGPTDATDRGAAGPTCTTVVGVPACVAGCCMDVVPGLAMDHALPA